jgi:hypothetical protein
MQGYIKEADNMLNNILMGIGAATIGTATGVFILWALHQLTFTFTIV